jgi:tetratricopeptide (TPR) repeat protein
MKKQLLLLTVLMMFLSFAQSPALAGSSEIESASNLKKTADAFLRLGEIEKAVLEYQKSISADPAFEAAYFNLAIAYYSLGRNADARAALQKLVELNPKDVEALYNLGCLSLYDRQVEKAALCFESAKNHCDCMCAFSEPISTALILTQRLNRLDFPTQAAVIEVLRKGLAV